MRDEVDSFLRLSEDQLEQLSTYLDATYLLNRCLALAYVPDRQAIEAQMLLPLVD